MPQNPTDPNWGASSSNPTDPNWGAAAPDVGSSTTVPEPVRPESMGRQLGRAALNALPGIGGIVGGALSTPETMGTGTIAGVALGAGAGRGMRDILTEYFGLEPPSTATSKGTRIALDVGETAALSAIIPGLIEAAKTPGQTVKSLMELLPAKLRPAIPPSLERAPARILTRPAWQTWEQNAPQAAPAPNTQITGTSMAPAPMPLPVARPAAPEPPVGPSEPPPTPTEAPKPAGPPSQKQLNEEAIARRRAAYQESLKAQPAAETPTARVDDLQAKRVGMPDDLKNDINLLADERDWMKAVKTPGSRVSLPDGTVGTVVRPAADPVNGGRVLVKHEMEGQPVERFYNATELSPAKAEAAPIADPMGDLRSSSSFSALPTDAERRFPPNKSGLPFNPPRVVKARGMIADLADMPPSEPAAAAGPTAEDIARVSAATKKKFSGTISDLADVPEAGRQYALQQEAKNLTPEVDYALKWIEADMEHMPFNKRTVIPHPEPGHGGDTIGIGGSAGSKIYRLIVGQEGQQVSGAGRADVIKAIKNLRAGKVTPVGELVLGVAKDLSGMSMAQLQKIMETGPP